MKPRGITGSVVLFFCMFICINAAAQKTEVYKIEYGVIITSTSSEDMLDNDGEPMISAYVNQERIRVEENGYSPSVQVSNLTDSISFQYFTDLKLAQQVPLVTPKISINPFSEDQDMWDSSQMELILMNETTVIAGYECHLAQFSLGQSDEILVWYVKGLPQLFWADYDYLQRVPGLPLKIISNIKESNFNFGIVATSVEKAQIDVSFFGVPADYKIQSSEKQNE